LECEASKKGGKYGDIGEKCGEDESSLRGFLTGAAVVRKGKEKARQSQEWKQKWQVRRLRRQTSEVEVEGKERGCLNRSTLGSSLK
jgi:hypothetical protein